MHWR
jgi:hypothetical protein